MRNEKVGRYFFISHFLLRSRKQLYQHRSERFIQVNEQFIPHAHLQ